MASEIRVDKINSLSGVGTVTLSPTGVDIAGITTAATLRATTGIVTSLTAGSLTSLGAVSGTTGTFSGAVSGTTGTFTGNVAVSGANITLQDSGSASDDRIALGAGGDLQLFHDATNSVISNVTGDLYIENDSSSTTEKIYIRPKAGEESIKCTANGAVDLYHDNTNYLSTSSSGVDVKVTSTDTSTPPDKYLLVYNANDGANTMAGIRFVATSNSSSDHYIFQKKHGSGTGADLVISQNTNERIRFTEHGGITFGGDTAAANSLDDYEEGTWTPTLSGFTNGGSADNATYVKIGQIVHIGLNIFQTNNNMATQVGSFITGLPFAISHLQGVFIGGYADKDVSGAYLVTDGSGNRIIIMSAQTGIRHLWTTFTYRTTS